MDVIRTVANAYVKASILAGRGFVTHRLDGAVCRYKYKNVAQFYSVRDAIQNGETSEGIPISLLNRSGHPDAVIDVGAHHGIYSVLLGILNPESELYCFEPADAARSRLIENLELNGLRARAKVSDNVVNNTSNSAVPFREDSIPGSEKHGIAEEFDEKTITKYTVSLSDILNGNKIETAFVKIDAEGAEGEIVDDIVRQQYADVAGVIEIHPDKLSDYNPQEIIETLSSNKYNVKKITDSAPNYSHPRPIYSFRSE